MYQDWNLIQQDTAAQAKIEEEQRAEREAKERLDAVWKSFLGDDAAGLARRHRHAVEQASNAPYNFDFHTGWTPRRRWPTKTRRLLL